MKYLNIKFLVSFFVSCIFLSSLAYADGCSYTSRDSSCEIFTSPFNSFNLNFIEGIDVDSYEVSIYEKSNNKNRLKLDVNYQTNVVNNINPFTKPGVYVLDVIATNRAGKSFPFSQEFLFDNLKPNLPVVPVNLNTQSNTIDVLGTALFSSEIIVADKFGTTIKRVNVLADDSFIINLNLNDGINFFKFASVGKNGLVSDFVDRVIISSSKSVINFNPSVSSINLDDNSVVNNVIDSYTLKRNHFVSGNIGSSNSRVFISGNPVVSDDFGNFAGFVNLNQGLNSIEIKSGDKVKSYDVTFILDKFRFTKFDVTKFTTSPVVNLDILTLYDLDFDIYLNGEFVSTKKAISGELNLDLNGLRYGKNYIYLSGPDGAKAEKLVYYDNKKPEIEVVSSNLVSNKNEFIFEIQDDFGFDISKTIFKLNSNVYSNEHLDVRGNYFLYDIENLPAGDYSYSILVYDLTGNFKEIFGSFVISDSVITVDEVIVSNGGELGNRIFFNELGDNNVKFIFSENIAFENIYLDGEDQTNYKIDKENLVDLDIKLTETSGEFVLNFIDNNRNKFSKTFSYKVISKPKIELDFISNPILKTGNTVVVTGRVISDYFDWSSFKINSGVESRFGNYFEIYVVLDRNTNLVISGRDFMGNSLSYVFNGVGVDNSNLILQFLNENNEFFSGSVINSQSKVLEFVNSYDGIYTTQVLPQNFNLVAGQRSGLRSLNLHGKKESLVKFDYDEIVSIDGINPEIYFLETKVIILGTLSEVDRILVNGNEIGVGDRCLNTNGYWDFCREINLVSVGDEIEVFDSYENSFSRIYTGVSDVLDKSDMDLKYYFTGNDIYVESKNAFVQGQILSNEKVSDVSTHFGDCDFDDFNFVCDVDLETGHNNVDVTITTVSGDSTDGKIVVIIPDNETGTDDDNLCSGGTGQGSDMDSDNDGICDDLDSDDDNDGIPDKDDNDDDGDGIPDEDDNDSGDDGHENLCSGGAGQGSDMDSDNDGICDNEDLDDDNDGTPDEDDSDDDGDGIIDENDNDSGGQDSDGDKDSDNDGIADNLDSDDDNDGIADEDDNDDDGDGILDEDDNDSGSNDGDKDSDNDGIDDDSDLDDDNDGIPDEVDSDDDGDGILDEDDNDSGDLNPPYSLTLSQIYGDSVYEVLDKFYTDTNKVSVSGDVSKKVPIKLVINNEEFLVGEFDGRVNIFDVDLKSYVSGSDETNLEFKLRVTDDFDNNKDSNVLVLVYNRILKTLVDVIVN